MNKGVLTSVLTLLFCTSVFAQSDLQKMAETERAFHQAAAEKGMKSAFLEFLALDSVIFRPDAINGMDFWTRREDSSTALLIRNSTYADIAANGLLGFTTGTWELFPNGKTDPQTEFGQYVTVWAKKPDGTFRASVDIGTTYEKLPVSETNKILPTTKSRDLNKRGWSAADPSMYFFRMSMSKSGLSGAYKKFAANEIRLLREREPPITGKKNVISETRDYISIAFPRKIALFQAADMAYVWNACEFANSKEGTEKGNCLHIWKLRKEKWWIVLSVFARIHNENPPKLNIRQKNRNSQ